MVFFSFSIPLINYLFLILLEMETIKFHEKYPLKIHITCNFLINRNNHNAKYFRTHHDFYTKLRRI